MINMKLTKEIIEEGVRSKGYRWFEKGDYNLNIVGVRNSNTGTEVTNKFDDKITSIKLKEVAHQLKKIEKNHHQYVF